MKKLSFPLCVTAVLVLVPIAGTARTTCAGFGTPAALLSPTPGSTLPTGAVTFAWCNVNTDYFLRVEDSLGSHDLFNAFVGNVGPGAGVVSVTLDPASARLHRNLYGPYCARRRHGAPHRHPGFLQTGSLARSGQFRGRSLGFAACLWARAPGHEHFCAGSQSPGSGCPGAGSGHKSPMGPK